MGIRKSIFSDTEKEVTDKVILRREQTVQELADVQATDSGSVGHLNASSKMISPKIISVKLNAIIFFT